MTKDERFMNVAITEARKGLEEGGIPIGAVLAMDGKIVGRGHNRRVQENSQVLHAEMDAFRNAGRGVYRDATLYTTLYPCCMCAGAAALFGITKIVVGEDKTFCDGVSTVIMEMAGIEVVVLDLDEPRIMMDMFIAAHPDAWDEDIGF